MRFSEDAKTFATRPMDQAKNMTYKQAMKSDDQENYRKAITDYNQGLIDTKALEIVQRMNAIGSRWVCYQKFNTTKQKPG